MPSGCCRIQGESKISPEYAAGLFDGEGYIWFVKSKVGKRYTIREYRYQMYAAITLREKWLLEQLQTLVGAGHLTNVKSLSDRHAPYYKLMWSGKSLDAFLNVVGPHLIAKAVQKNIAIRVSTLKNANGNKSITDESYEEQTQLWEYMKIANQKGVAKVKEDHPLRDNHDDYDEHPK